MMNDSSTAQDTRIHISDECEREKCSGTYKFSFNGGGTCDKCGHKIPCF